MCLTKVHEAKTDRTARETDESIMIVGDFNMSPSVINRPSRQKIGEDIVELNSTTNQLELSDICKI